MHLANLLLLLCALMGAFILADDDDPGEDPIGNPGDEPVIGNGNLKPGCPTDQRCCKCHDVVQKTWSNPICKEGDFCPVHPLYYCLKTDGCHHKPPPA